MWFYADTKSRPMSPTMTPIKVLPGSPKVLPGLTPRGTPGKTARVTPRLTPKMTPRSTPRRPGSPKVVVRPGSPKVVVRPGSPKVVVRPGSPKVVRPPMSPKVVRPPGSPKLHRGKRDCKVMPASPDLFKGCDTSFKTVPVPRVKYVLNQHPVVFEKIHKKVKFDQIPVSYEFEKKQHPIRVVKSPCSPCQGGVKQHKGHHHHKASPCQLKKQASKLPCAMQDADHLNRLPCKNTSPLGKSHWDPALKSADLFKNKQFSWMGKNAESNCPMTGYGGKSPCKTGCGKRSPCVVSGSRCGKSPCGITFPRWQSQYVRQGTSPCAVSTTARGEKTRCGTC